jgi:hypothetical protein
MKLIFADDSRQNNPSRPGMGPLVAIGGLSVDAEDVRSLNDSIDAIGRIHVLGEGWACT